MKLSELLNRLLAETPLTVSSVSLYEDFDLPEPEALMQWELHWDISDAVAQAALANNLSDRGASAFAAWLAKLCTGWSMPFSNEDDVLRLNAVFGKAAFGDPKEVVQLFLLPDWETFDEYEAAIQAGVKAAFKAASAMG